jgi:hypothetical protein
MRTRIAAVGEARVRPLQRLNRGAIAAAAAALAASLAACSDAGLEAVQNTERIVYDDKLAVKGSICTATPSDEFFPVKILFVVDTSYSMQVTDPAKQRVVAVTDVIARFAGNPSVKIAVAAFDAVATNITNGFTSNPDLTAVSRRIGDSDRLTDYQGALGLAYSILTEDMLRASPAERARSKYVVIFFSDGVPDPQCFASNGNMQTRQVCNIPRDAWPSAFQLPPGTNPNTGAAWTWDDFQGLYPELEAGKDYNTPDQLALKVQDILQLQEIYNVNEIRFHTGLLFDPNVGQAFIDAFDLRRDAAIEVLSRMAEAGNGTFTEFTSGNEISFLNINYTSTKQLYEMTNFIAWNGNSVVTPNGPAVDSDGDGLTDDYEADVRLCAFERGNAPCNLGMGRFRDPLDSDADGYSDFFEHTFRASGFDPLVPATMTTPCVETDDTDGDGLRDCEEIYLTTDPRLVDSDTDRIPDGLEVRFGMNPADARDALFDADADGMRNGLELLAHRDPFSRENVANPPPEVKYEVKFQGETQEGKSCYGFDVTNLKLHTTKGITVDKRGYNTVWFSFLEGPRNDPRDFGSMRVACVRARYIEPDVKLPADGAITLTEADFFAPNDPALTCVGPDRPTPVAASAR